MEEETFPVVMKSFKSCAVTAMMHAYGVFAGRNDPFAGYIMHARTLYAAIVFGMESQLPQGVPLRHNVAFISGTMNEAARLLDKEKKEHLYELLDSRPEDEETRAMGRIRVASITGKLREYAFELDRLAFRTWGTKPISRPLRLTL